MTIPLSFFDDCAFVSVDFQGDAPEPGTRLERTTKDKMMKDYQKEGKSPEDIDAVRDFTVDVAKPNAIKIADMCRQLELPMIFIHWGYMFKDAMDLDPEVYDHFMDEFGADKSKWPHHMDGSDSFPMLQYGVREGEYVLAKTAQDTFTSSNIDYVLRNLKVRNIIFVGGHTGACLGKTIRSARERGYKTLVIEDATNDAFESTRLPHIKEFGYDYRVKTKEFLSLVETQLNLGQK